jgi:hypothetical protein
MLVASIENNKYSIIKIAMQMQCVNLIVFFMHFRFFLACELNLYTVRNFCLDLAIPVEGSMA